MSEPAYRSALCIGQNIHILKLAEPNEHPALIDDPIVVWRNLHNRYFTLVKFDIPPFLFTLAEMVILSHMGVCILRRFKEQFLFKSLFSLHTVEYKVMFFVVFFYTSFYSPCRIIIISHNIFC